MPKHWMSPGQMVEAKSTVRLANDSYHVFDTEMEAMEYVNQNYNSYILEGHEIKELHSLIKME